MQSGREICSLRAVLSRKPISRSFRKLEHDCGAEAANVGLATQADHRGAATAAGVAQVGLAACCFPSSFP